MTNSDKDRLPVGRLSPERQPASIDLADRVRQLSADLGLGGADYELIQVSSNTVFENPKDRVVARVASDHVRTWGIAARLAECQQLAEAGAPFLIPLRSEVFQLPGGDRTTFWPLAVHDLDPNGHDLAALATATHQVEPPMSLNEWRPQMRRPGQLASLAAGLREGLPPAFGDQLRDIYDRRLQELVLYWQQLDPATTLIHGDFSPSNVVRLDGELLMCDPDNLCRGPVEADLAKIKLDCQALDPVSWDQFLASYQLDYDAELLDKVFRVNEVGALMWSTDLWQSRPAVRSGFEDRLSSLEQEGPDQLPETATPAQVLAETQSTADYLAAELIESIRQLRTDRPHPGMIDNTLVTNQEGSRSVNRLAVVELAGAQNLLIRPFDPADIGVIAAAILANQQPGWQLAEEGTSLNLTIPPTDERKQQLVAHLRNYHQASLSQLRRQYHKDRGRIDPQNWAEAEKIYQAAEEQMRRIVTDRRQAIVSATCPQPSPVMARRAAQP